jgi:hypothetical protein
MQIKGRRETRTLGHSIQGVKRFLPAASPRSAHQKEDAMTMNADVASAFDFVEAEAASTDVVAAQPANTERRDSIIFFLFFFALLGAIVLTAATVGLAGVGMIAIGETAAMLVVCFLLTAG